MKAQALKKIETIKSKVQALWYMIEGNYNTDCQTIMRELSSLEKGIESGDVKIKKKK